MRRRVLWRRRLARIRSALYAACAVAIISSLLLLWLRLPNGTASCLILGAGFIAALAWAAVERLSPLSAAIWADHRWHLKDLLATAWSIRLQTDDPWKMSLLALAERRSAELRGRPAEIMRGEARRWSGVALSGALVLAVGLFSPDQGDSWASFSPLAGVTPQSAATVEPAQTVRPPPPGDSAVDEPSNRTGGSASAADDARSGPPGDSADGRSQADGQASGAGLAQTAVRQQTARIAVNAEDSIASHQGTIAGAGGPQSTAGEAADAGGQAGAGKPISVAPWETSAWQAARSAALADIAGGKIDPTCQDLVRDYFQRP